MTQSNLKAEKAVFEAANSAVTHTKKCLKDAGVTTGDHDSSIVVVVTDNKTGSSVTSVSGERCLTLYAIVNTLKQSLRDDDPSKDGSLFHNLQLADSRPTELDKYAIETLMEIMERLHEDVTEDMAKRRKVSRPDLEAELDEVLHAVAEDVKGRMDV